MKPGTRGAIAAPLPAPEVAEDGAALLLDIISKGDGPQSVRPAAPSAVEAALVVQRGFAMPGLLLADGSVLVLGWSQLRPLVETFEQWRALSPKACGDAT
jgi:hypothetical protein